MTSQTEELITRNLQEVLGLEKLKEIIKSRPVKIYWGTATTGKPHVGYFVPICKIADFLHAGCEVTILFADLHAYLDNMKAPWALLELRSQYYEHIIKAMLSSIDVDLKMLRFVRGTEYQLSREYSLDVYKITSIVTQHDAKKAGAEVVKQVQSPLLSGLMYPCLQALDEQYLGVDAQFGGVDQRKIFTFAEKHLPMLGYGKRIHLMNPIVPSLSGDKMSSSESEGKIDLLDPPNAVEKKIKKAFCEPGKVDGNWCLSFSKYVLFPVLWGKNEVYTIKVNAIANGNSDHLTYRNYADLERDFVQMNIHPADLKRTVADYLNKLLSPILAIFNTIEMKELCERAYQTGRSKTNHGLSTNVNAISGHTNVDIREFDLRVAEIIETTKHASADNLLVHRLGLGSDRTIQICSNLAPYIRDELPRFCVVLCNVNPVNIKGVESVGHILAQVRDKPEKRGSLFVPPTECRPGDRVWFGSLMDECPDQSKAELMKVKQWDKIQSSLKFHQDGSIRLDDDRAMKTSNGNVKCFLNA